MKRPNAKTNYLFFLIVTNYLNEDSYIFVFKFNSILYKAKSENIFYKNTFVLIIKKRNYKQLKSRNFFECCTFP